MSDGLNVAEVWTDSHPADITGSDLHEVSISGPRHFTEQCFFPRKELGWRRFLGLMVACFLVFQVLFWNCPRSFFNVDQFFLDTKPSVCWCFGLKEIFSCILEDLEDEDYSTRLLLGRWPVKPRFRAHSHLGNPIAMRLNMRFGSDFKVLANDTVRLTETRFDFCKAVSLIAQTPLVV